MTDLYEALGVHRTAGEADIKQAYRTKAKTLHPDQGGGNEAFAELHAAYTTLIDPKKRAAYDRDGTTDFAADNERALALEVVGRLFDGVMSTFSDPQVDTPYIDVVEAMRDKLRANVADMSEKIAKMEGAAERLTKFAKRFSAKKDGQPFLRQMVEAKVRAIAGGVRQAKRQLDLHEAALELLKDQKFKFEPPPQFVQMAAMPQFSSAGSAYR